MISQKHNPYLDGLRGIAILMVICYHYFTGFYIFDFGWSGVDMFFVLSGYLLSGRLYPYLADKKLLWKFYFNRFLRIVPLFYLFLAVFFLGWFCLASPETIRSVPLYKTALPGFFAFFANWIFIQHFSAAHDHLNHLWSLAVEEQLYIFFPLLIIFIRDKKKLLAAGVFLVTLVFSGRMVYFLLTDHAEYLKIYWNTFFRADSFLAGFLLYMLIHNGFAEKIKRWLRFVIPACLAILIAGMLYQASMRVGLFFVSCGFTVIAVLYAGAVFYAVSAEDNFIKKISSGSFLKYTGRISYGLYIFHWPIFLVGFSVCNMLLRKINLSLNPDTIQLINAAFSVIVTYLISAVSFRYYESFFLKWKLRAVKDQLPA